MLLRSRHCLRVERHQKGPPGLPGTRRARFSSGRWRTALDRKSTRLNSSHLGTSTAEVCHIAVYHALAVSALPSCRTASKRTTRFTWHTEGKVFFWEIEDCARSEEHTSELQSLRHVDRRGLPYCRIPCSCGLGIAFVSNGIKKDH